jgi:hypothetical protein
MAFMYSAVPQRAFSLQSNFIRQASTLNRFAALKASQESGDAVRESLLLSIAAIEANTWKRVIPSSPLHTLSDAQYRIAARLNLGLPPYRVALPSSCPSCKSPTALRDDRWHHLSCVSHRRLEVTHRHDAVLNVLYAYTRAAGGIAVKEPAGLSVEDGKRPDLQIIFPSRHIITDVVIPHPLAPSHLHRASNRAAATAELAASRKVKKYAQVSQTQHASFIPFAVESTGGMSVGARELLQQIALASNDHLRLDPEQARVGAMQGAVAIAIQRGNALCMFAGMSRALRAGGWSEEE